MADYELFDWDSEIEEDGQEFRVVEPGDYNFTVKNIERKNFPGSQKMPACNMVVVTGEIETAKGPAYFHDNMYLIKRNEWKLSGFFRCVGMKKHGEKLKMDWNGAVGRTGRANIGNREYQGNTYNEVKKYYDHEVGKPNGFSEAKDDDIPW